MELQDLQQKPTEIRDNLQISGPSSAVKNRDKLMARYKDDALKLAQFEKLPVNPKVTAESRVVTKDTDVVYAESITVFVNDVVGASARIGALQGTTQRIEVAAGALEGNNCYWLPWGEGEIHMGQLGRDHDYFFTYTINGCGVMIGGTDTQPQVAHANLDCARLNAAVLEGNKKLGAKPSISARDAVAREIERDQALIYEQFYGNLAAKLIEKGDLSGGRIAVVTPDQYLIRAGAGFGAVFGVKGIGGAWSFYGNWAGKTTKIW